VLSSAEPRAINVDSTAMAKKLRALEPRDLALAADLDLEHAWRVEYVDRGGVTAIAIFAGQSAELRRATTMTRSSVAPSTAALPMRRNGA
jgi:hypothetical protein